MFRGIAHAPAALWAGLLLCSAFVAGCAGSTEPSDSDGGLTFDAPQYEVASPVPISDEDASLPTRGPQSAPDAQVDAVVGPPAACRERVDPTVVLQEIAVGQPDFVALKNVTGQPLDLEGYRLVLSGINPMEPREHTFAAGVTVAAGQLLYVFEYKKGDQPDDVNTATNIPFYDGPPQAAHPNAAVLYDPDGRLLDYVGVGPAAINLPAGASFMAIPWSAGFDATTTSFQRQGLAGACPEFAASDWTVAPKTR